MTLLQKLFSNAALPTQFGSQSYETKLSKFLAAEAWWREEMRVLRKFWVRSGWAVLPGIDNINANEDVPQ